MIILIKIAFIFGLIASVAAVIVNYYQRKDNRQVDNDAYHKLVETTNWFLENYPDRDIFDILELKPSDIRGKNDDEILEIVKDRVQSLDDDRKDELYKQLIHRDIV